MLHIIIFTIEEFVVVIGLSTTKCYKQFEKSVLMRSNILLDDEKVCILRNEVV